MLQILYDLCHETLQQLHLQAHKTYCNLNHSAAKQGSGRHSCCYLTSPWHGLLKFSLVAFTKIFKLFPPFIWEKKKKKPFTMFNQDDDTDCNSFLLLPWNISLKHFYCNLIYHKLGKRTKKNSC